MIPFGPQADKSPLKYGTFSNRKCIILLPHLHYFLVSEIWSFVHWVLGVLVWGIWGLAHWVIWVCELRLHDQEKVALNTPNWSRGFDGRIFFLTHSYLGLECAPTCGSWRQFIAI